MGRLLIQFPGSTNAKVSSEILPKNTIVVDEENKQLRLHDGNTPGGFPIGDRPGETPANVNLNNLTSTGQNIANWSTNLSNCLTEIPQNVKLELNNGTLTVKAGTVYYVPNGAGVFTKHTLETDKTVAAGSANELYFILIDNNGNANRFHSSAVYSGATAPTVTGSAIWYDTTNNEVKYTSNSGSTWTGGWSLPIAICTPQSGSWVSIDQTFNGIGYIASTIFVLPGTTYLAPNGRNVDGSLKTLKNAYDVVKVYTRTDTFSGVLNLIGYNSQITVAETRYQKTPANGTITFDMENNISYSSLSVATLIDFGAITFKNGKVVSLTSNEVFRAVDYRDLENVVANRNMSNLLESGKNIANWSNNVSNCTRYIPQDINLTLSSGTLTLKKGSTYYTPSGTATTTTSDKTATSNSNGARFVYMNLSSGNIVVGSTTISETCSGSTDSLVGTPWHTWFDTTNNVINRYGGDGTTFSYNTSLPIAIVTVSGGVISSIDQIFNGFGYIGHHSFLLPGAEFLIPNGFNTDGTLKSTVVTRNNPYVRELSGSETSGGLYVQTNGAVYTGVEKGRIKSRKDASINGVYYVENENKNVQYYNGVYQEYGVLGATYTSAGGVITSFNVRTVFHAIDYSNLDNLIPTIDGKADTSLSNLTNSGKNIGNWSTNVSNCIVEMPQDVSLELSNGTLTLKAGSVVYRPNGAGTYQKLTTVAATCSDTDSSTYQAMVFYDNSASLEICPLADCASGTSTPMSGAYVYYNTSTNKINLCVNGVILGNDYSFPVAIVTMSGASGITSIDHVFNGIGYIGSTVYALPGVKVSIPNGRNADGSLKNISLTTSSVSIGGISYASTDLVVVLANNGTIGVAPGLSYDEETNYVYSSGGALARCIVGSAATTTGGVITSFNIKRVFHAMDYIDIQDFLKTIAINKAQSGYMKLSNGLIIQWGYSNAGQYSGANKGVNLPTAFSSGTSYVVTGAHFNSTATNQAFGIKSQSSSSFVWHSVANDDGGINWIAIGY